MLDTIIFYGFFLLTLGIGITAGRHIKNFSDFAISRGTFGTFSLVATIVASFVGGAVIMGTAEKTFSHGIGYMLALFGFPIQFLLMTYYIIPKMPDFSGALSIGDIISKAYGKRAQILTGILWISFSIGIITVQMLAMSITLSWFLTIKPSVSLLVSGSIVTTYCLIGGIRAVVWTDVVQFILLGVMIPLTVILGIQYAGGINNLLEAMPASHFNPFDHMHPLAWITIFISFIFGDALIPPVIQRILMARNKEQSTKSMKWGAILMFVLCVFAGLLGLIGYAIDTTITPNQVVIFTFDTVLPIGMRGLAAAGLLAVIMSSADSYLNSAAVVLVRDIITPFRLMPLGEKTSLRLAQLITLIIGISAVFIAMHTSNIMDTLLHTYKFWGPVIVPPLAALCMGKKISKVGFFVCCGVGAATVILWEMMDMQSHTFISSLIVGIFANAATFFLFFKKLSSSQK